MSTIVTRAGKGSALSYTEADANFTNLNNDKLESADYTAADVLTKVKSVDGAGSGLDADLLDGQHAADFLAASDYTAADVLTKIKTVDGAASGLDADLLDGNEASAFALSGHNHTGVYADASHNHAASEVTSGTLDNARLPTTIDQTIVKAKQFGTTEYDAGNSGTTKTIDFANGQNQKLTLTGNVAVTLSNPVAGNTCKVKILSGSGSFTVTFSTTVKWPGGVAYVASTAASKTDIVTLYYDGSAWWGTYSNNFA
jgi:hypothetical protein